MFIVCHAYRASPLSGLAAAFLTPRPLRAACPCQASTAIAAQCFDLWRAPTRRANGTPLAHFALRRHA